MFILFFISFLSPYFYFSVLSFSFNFHPVILFLIFSSMLIPNFILYFILFYIIVVCVTFVFIFLFCIFVFMFVAF